MNLKGNTILITGGASGIGFALAERFLERGNNVIICGRRDDKLLEAKEKHPELHTYVCDVSEESQRKQLFEWAIKKFPELNVLVNNAGIQQRTNLLKNEEPWSYHHHEIVTNLEAPLHLTMLFLQHLASKEKGAIINVSSGLAFTPMAMAPVYCATKAALHSFTVSLRYQIASTGIEVIEVIPPAVNTDLGGVNLHTFGAPLDEFADGVFRGLENNQSEIGYGSSENSMRMSRDEIDATVQRINGNVKF